MSTLTAPVPGNDISSHPRIEAALKRAAKATGVDFKYLVDTASRESNLKTGAKSSASSASGLFQFIDETWLSSIKEFGPKLGLSRLSNAIERTQSGRHKVPNATLHREILSLRTDPGISALMAGAYAGKSAAHLREQLGREPRHGEIYITHFLGIKGGSELIAAAANNPNTSAARMFPGAAKSNPSIFYNKGGSARSARQVYFGLVSKHSTDVAVNTSSAPRRVARVPGQPLKLNTDMIHKSGRPRPAEAALLAHANYSKFPTQTGRARTTTTPDVYRPTAWPVKPQPLNQKTAQSPSAGPGSLGYQEVAPSNANSTAGSDPGSLVTPGKKPFAGFAQAAVALKAHAERVKPQLRAFNAPIALKPTVLGNNDEPATVAKSAPSTTAVARAREAVGIGQIFIQTGSSFFTLRGKQ